MGNCFTENKSNKKPDDEHDDSQRGDEEEGNVRPVDNPDQPRDKSKAKKLRKAEVAEVPGGFGLLPIVRD